MTWVATGLFIAGVALTTYNTIQTQNRADRQAVQSIQNQARRQRTADARVDQEVQALEQSTAQDERRTARDAYLQALGANKRSATVGLPEGVGGEAFRTAANDATMQVQRYGAQNADLMATMEGAITQRQGEGFGYGRLGTDLGLIARQAEGDAHIDQLRQASIRRNPWLDMAGGMLTAGAGAAGGGGAGGMAGGMSQLVGGGGAQVGGNAASTQSVYGQPVRRYGMK